MHHQRASTPTPLPPLISTLPPSLSPRLLSTCYPTLCLSHRSSVLLIPSEKKRQSRKSPLHLCHTLPRSLLSLAPVSCWPPSSATTSTLSHQHPPLFIQMYSPPPLSDCFSYMLLLLLPALFLLSWDVICWFLNLSQNKLTITDPAK